MKIAIDIDEVLANTLEAFLNYYNKRYGTSFTKEQFHTYDWWKVMSVSVDDVLERFYSFIRSAEGPGIKPVEGAKEAIINLSKNHKLSLVTGRPKDIATETYDWLDKHFCKCFDDIHFADDFINPINFTKGNVCREINASLMIEDMPRHSFSCAEADVEVFLFDRPWNQEVAQSDKIRRVYSWNDIAGKLANNEF